MNKILQIFIGLFFFSCTSPKDFTGTYIGKNYFGTSELILNKDKEFTFTIDRAMMADSISGFYKLIGNRIKLVNSTKNSQIIIIDKKKSNNAGKIELEFIDADYGDTLIINQLKTELDPFNNFKFTINCDDRMEYIPNFSKEKIKLDSINCGNDYRLSVFRRSIHEIIPDTFDIKIKKNKFDFQNFTLKKRKHNKELR